jgi:hypothetical protein
MTVHTNMQTNHLLDVLVCTCGHFLRTGTPCRHIYCVLQRPPRATDCNIRQLKIYESYFGRDQQVTSILLESILTPLEGPLVGHTSLLEPNPSESFDLNWFKEATDTIVLRPGVENLYLSGMQGSIRTVTNCYDSPDDDMGFQTFGNYDHDSPDDDTGFQTFGNDDHEDVRGEEEDTNDWVKDPFQSLAPSMVDLYNLIEKKSDLSIVQKHLSMARVELLEMKREKVQTGSRTASMKSFPETDRRRKDCRKMPAGSPRRKGFIVNQKLGNSDIPKS